MMRTLCLALLLVAAPALAQAPAAPVAEPDPARLAAAQALVAVVMPPALQARVIDQTTGAMLTTMTTAITSQPALQAAFAREPRARPIFDRFLERNQAATRTMMTEGMPGMVAALTRAYARRMTTADMAQAQRFFATPAGQTYLLEAASVMSDPDVGAWMQTTMTNSLARMKPETDAVMAELRALSPPAK